MAEVTYLLGAGASWERIPTVLEMGDKIKEVISTLTNMTAIGYNHLDPKSNRDPTVIHNLPEIITDLKWMDTNNDSHSSIDTFAKKLYLTQKVDDLKRLKLILSFFFTYLQIAAIPDKRYDNFWASILNRPNQLPRKVKILSWNYDFQLEQSYLNMSNIQDLKTASDWINVINYSDRSYAIEENFAIIKLNGSAKIIHPQNGETQFLLNSDRNSDFGSNFKLLTSLYIIAKRYPQASCKLSFAWETGKQNIKDILHPFISNTEVVAIIGYSFPFFNREIDIELFKGMQALQTVYIQDTEPQDIKEKMREVINFNNHYGKKVQVIEVKNCKQFVFPKELEII